MNAHNIVGGLNMGSIKAAAVVSHQPGIMLPEARRMGMNGGYDTTLVAGFAEIGARLDVADVDTLVIIDTHWFTTAFHIVAGADRYRGTYTSDELPMMITDLPYDYPGAPALAALVAQVGSEHQLPVFNTTSDHIGIQYPTINLVHHLHWDRPVLRVGVCQHAEAHNFLAFGAVLGEAIERSDARVGILASGGMSHRFPPLDVSSQHVKNAAEHVITAEARAFDESVLSKWTRGDHGAVIDAYDDYAPFKPEGRLGHYLIMAGALGGRDWSAPGLQLSDYENAFGTGQVHMWFDLTNERQPA
jgi:3,4-dihydroxyphenylacetate 2,3-dioxygenase